VSILLALVVQAWWEGRNEDLQRRALLSVLESDMAFASAEVDRVLTVHRAGRDAAATLLTLRSLGPLGSDQALRVDSLLAAVRNVPTYEAPLGALDALVASGDLHLLGNPELVVELTSFPAIIASLEREQELLVGALLQLSAYLRENGVDHSDLRLLAAPPWEIRPTRAYTLVSDPGFRGMLDQMWGRFRNTSANLERVEDAVGRMSELLAVR